MRRFFFGLFAAFGFVTMLSVIGIGVAIWYAIAAKPSLPDTIVLTADLDGGLAAGASQDPLSELLFGDKPSVRDFLDALERAREDPRVKALYVHVGADALALATCQEVRDAIRDFRAKGKFALAFSESFGEFGPGTRPYYVATAFDEIWLQPLGSVGLIGLQAQIPFFRGALDKLGIRPSFAQREQYKTAMNSLTETAMTPPQREEVEGLLGSTSGQIVRGIAAARQLSEAQVAGLVDRGPLFAEEAKDARLVDRIGYRDEAVAQARQRAGSGAELMSLSRYLDAAGRPHESGDRIALIYGTGVIVQSATDSLVGGGAELSARKVSRAFREASRDDEVRAIVFRVDSPGGSAIASETIWREVARAREHGKPVIVSMGNSAASGGYYIAAPADKIVAQPATLTGSIGVLAGKLVIAGLLDKLGITEESVQRGANSGMFSGFEDFTPAGRARLEAFLDVTYRGFKERVASGRRMSLDQVEAVAKGRVWSGEEAKARGLVDELGGFDVALRLAKEAAKIPADKSFELTVFPRTKSTLELLFERFADGKRETDNNTPARARGIAARLERVATTVELLLTSPGVLHMPMIGEPR